MDVRIERTEICPCGKNVVGVSGRCDECISRGRALLELYLTGEISFPAYVRRMRRRI